MCLSSVEKHPRLTWFWIIAVSFLLSAALVVGFGIHSFHGLFATRCEKEIIASSPDGQYALIIRPWSGWDSTGADFYCRSSSGTTKIGGISAAGHNHPFRDGHYRIVWEPDAVTILYGTANLSQWETVTYHLQAVTETSIEKM